MYLKILKSELRTPTFFFSLQRPLKECLIVCIIACFFWDSDYKLVHGLFILRMLTANNSWQSTTHKLHILYGEHQTLRTNTRIICYHLRHNGNHSNYMLGSG